MSIIGVEITDRDKIPNEHLICEGRVPLWLWVWICRAAIRQEPDLERDIAGLNNFRPVPNLETIRTALQSGRAVPGARMVGE